MPKRKRTVEQTWESFDRQYELVRKFGVRAIQDKLNADLKAQAQTVKLNPQNVMDILGQVARKMDEAFSLGLEKVQEQLRLQQHSLRADNRPEVTNQDKLDVASQSKSSGRTKVPPFELKMDMGDPKVQNAIKQIAKNPNDAGPITQLFNDIKLKDQLQARAEHRLRNRPTPSPSKRKKIEPGY